MFVTWECCATVVPACLTLCSEEPHPSCGCPHANGLCDEHRRILHEHALPTGQMDCLVRSIHCCGIQWAPPCHYCINFKVNSSRMWPSLEDFLVYSQLLPCITIHCMWAACDMTHSLFSVQVSATSCPCVSFWALAETTLKWKTPPPSTSSLRVLACVWQVGSWPLCWQWQPSSLGGGRQPGGLKANTASSSANSRGHTL